MSASIFAPRRPDTVPLTAPLGLVALARRSARRRARHWPLRVLSRPERSLMWLLRLYVLAMLGVVALQLVRVA